MQAQEMIQLNSTQQIRNKVDDLRDYHGIKEGTFKLSYSSFDVQICVKKVLEML